MKSVHTTVLVLMLLLTGFAAAACGGDDVPGSPAQRPSNGGASSPDEDRSPEASPEKSPDDESEEGIVVEIEVANGKSSGVDDVVEVPLGETLEIRVTSDVNEEVHVHGYDRTAELTAGQTTTLRFKADIPGVFEVELEESGKPLFELSVQ